MKTLPVGEVAVTRTDSAVPELLSVFTTAPEMVAPKSLVMVTVMVPSVRMMGRWPLTKGAAAEAAAS